jgi:L-aminopeptidase/D-esterase-like protein
LPCYDPALSAPDKQPKCKADAAGGAGRNSAAGAGATGETAGNSTAQADAGKGTAKSYAGGSAANGADNLAAAHAHAPPDVGSIIIVVATNAPLLPVQLSRVARRAALGMGRMGSYAGNQSGDLMMSFTTASAAADDPDQQHPSAITPLASDRLDPLFKAVVEATEESVVNALVAAQTMTGADGYRFYGLPHAQLRTLLKRYGRLEGGHAP